MRQANITRYVQIPITAWTTLRETLPPLYVMFSHLIVTFLITARYKYSYLLTDEFLVDKYP